MSAADLLYVSLTTSTRRCERGQVEAQKSSVGVNAPRLMAKNGRVGVNAPKLMAKKSRVGLNAPILALRMAAFAR